MPEKLCVRWNDFKDNINSSFRGLRVENDFADVTLACEDGEQLKAHRVILAEFIEKKYSSSPSHLHERGEV